MAVPSTTVAASMPIAITIDIRRLATNLTYDTSSSLLLDTWTSPSDLVKIRWRCI